MKNGESTTEYLKYTFSEDEKAALAVEMAEGVNAIAKAEDALKAVKSDFKSQIDTLTAGVNGNATKISSGFEYRNIECTVMADYDRKVWKIYRDDTAEMCKERKMTTEEMQGKLFGEGS